MTHIVRCIAVSVAIALAFSSGIAQTAAVPPAHTAPDPAKFHGRSWSDLWRAKEAGLEAAGQGEPLTLKRLTAPKGFHRDGGPLGTQSYSAYFSGSDTSLGFPTASQLFAGAQRQSNCSLTEYIVGYNQNTYKYEAMQTIPSFEKYLHTISGLTTTVDKFPNGCAEPATTGQIYKVIPAGLTSSGNYVSATYSFIFDNSIYVTVYSPTLSAVSSSSYYVGYNIAGLLAADFNGDGYQDLAVIDTATSAYSPAQISILIANGNGTFKSAAALPADTYLLGLVAADFNGDKKVDLVATAQKSDGDFELLFYAGNGDGTFKAPVATATGTTERLVSLPADINGDGKIDIAAWDFVPVSGVNTTSYTLDSLINNGSAVFTPTLSITAGLYSPFAAGDLNKDGKLDLVYTDTSTNSFSVLEGNGSGGFTFKGSWPTVFSPDSAYISDYDGDGNADILIGVGGQAGVGPVEEGQGEILLGNGDFTFSSPPSLQPLSSSISLFSGPHSFAVADLNGDAKSDVAVIGHGAANDSGQAPLAVTTYLNNGTNNLAGGTTVNFTATFGTTLGAPALVVAPLSGTKPNDLIVAGLDPSSQGPVIQAAINDGTGSFSVKSTLLDAAAPVVAMASADFNADGKGDIAFVATDGNPGDGGNALYTARGNGDGTFQAPVVLDSAVNDGGQVFTADVNGDGKPDIIAIQTTTGYSYVRVYLNQGTSFAAPVSFSTPDGAVIGWVIIADLNGDGKLDLGVIGSTASFFSTNLYLYTGNRTATFTYNSTVSVGDSQAGTGLAADINQDGIVDIVVDGYTGPSLLLGKGAGAFYPPQPFVVPQGASGVQAINLTSSPYPDLLFSIYNYTGSVIATSVNHYANAPTVAKAATAVNIASNSGPISQDETLELYPAVVETSAAGQPTGTISVSYNSTILQTVNLSGGQAYFQLPTTGFPPGTYTLTLTYNGDNFNLPSTATTKVLVQYATATTLTVNPAAIDYDGDVTLTVKVARTLSSGTPTGSVLIYYNDGDTVLTSLPLVNGVATLKTTVKGYPAGQYVLSAYYYGENSNTPADAGSGSHNVYTSIAPKGLTATTTNLTLSPDPITYGQTATLTATVAPGTGSTVPTGTVTFYALFYGKNYNLGTVSLNSKGVAEARASTASFGYYGYFSLHAVYNGNSTTYTSTSPTLSIYLRDASDVYFPQDTYTVTSGQPVTITAQVVQETSNPITGTVTFSAEGVKLATVATVNGAASLTASTTGLAKGTYTVTATYNGDQYNGIGSGTATVTIQ